MDPGSDVAGDLEYGDVGEYLELSPGSYAVSIRPAGAASGTPPAQSARVEVLPGDVRTLALTGSFADLALTSLSDDLTPPANGSARVRVLAAASGAPDADVSVEDGPVLATGLTFPAASGYADVPAGPVVVRLVSTGGTTTVPLDLRAGSVVSLLLLDTADGGLTLRPVVDAVSAATVPVGAVPAGGSGALSPAVLAAGPALAPTGVPAAATAVVQARRSLRSGTPEAPSRVRVPAVGVDGVVAGTGLGADGSLLVPADPSVAGWYAEGPVPGERGPAVVSGHVDWAGRPGVFAGLAGAQPGDEVVVDRTDGTSVRFVVSRVVRTPKDAFPTDAVHGPVPGAELRLITCGGPFDAATGSYTENVVVFARLR